MSDNPIHPLARRFEHFTQECINNQSPFYARLSSHTARSVDLLELAACAHRSPAPNLFFSAVHYLLLGGASHPLRDYYPSLCEAPRQEEGLSEAFSEFCQKYRSDIESILRRRLVQTNEVRRASYLLPAFGEVYARGGGRPLALVEVGTSAGLLLLWDRFFFRYSDGRCVGAADSLVQLDCELRGDLEVPVPKDFPSVGSRLGVDLHPIDLKDVNEQLWLRALVWPDHPERAVRLETAMSLALNEELDLRRGDALEILPKVLEQVATDETLCVFHNSALNQFKAAERDQFEEILLSASKSRPLHRVAAEGERLLLLSYDKGERTKQRALARYNNHGHWLEWIFEPDPWED